MLFHHRNCLIAFLFCATLFCVDQLRAEKTLRWKFTAGDSWHVGITQISKTETRGGIRPVKMTIEMSMEMQWSIDSVEQNTATMTQKFSRIALKMTVPQGEAIEFDSSSQATPTGISKSIADSVRPLLGVAFQIKMSDRGEIVDVLLSDAAAKALSSVPSKSKLKSVFTKEGLSELLRQSAVVLPAAGVNDGDDWDATTTAKTPIGNLAQTHTYTYQGPTEKDDKTLDKITVKSTLDLKAPASSDSKIAIKAHEQTGELFFDSAAGRFAETNVTQTIVSELPYRDMIIRSTVESSLRMKITLSN